MNRLERYATFYLGMIFSSRLLGLFMMVPVFSLYLNALPEVTPWLLGAAMGIYGLTQAIFQTPFGMLSDRFGRKPMIALGLSLFAVGSIIAATVPSIWGVILGRALQGGAAIGGVIFALLADVTREEVRGKAMALLGAMIGLSFIAAMLIGPILNGWMGVAGMFWVSAGLSLVAMGILFRLVPDPGKPVFHQDAEPELGQLRTVLCNPELLRLNGGIFVLHVLFTASFVAIPLVLQDNIGLSAGDQWKFYVPVIILGCAAMVPFLLRAEKKQRMKQALVGAVAVLIVSQLWFLLFGGMLWGLAVGLFIFMAAFTLLEATLPAMASRAAPARSKGTAMGVYSTAQFLGPFVGGLLGGWLYGLHQMSWIFGLNAVLGILWLVMAMQDLCEVCAPAERA